MSDTAKALRIALMNDLNGRKGFRLDGVDMETKIEWESDWDAKIQLVLDVVKADGKQEPR